MGESHCQTEGSYQNHVDLHAVFYFVTYFRLRSESSRLSSLQNSFQVDKAPRNIHYSILVPVLISQNIFYLKKGLQRGGGWGVGVGLATSLDWSIRQAFCRITQ